MDRREALKKLGLSFGFLVGTPTALSLLQGCARSGSTVSNPQFFTADEAVVITHIVDIILPATADTPSASEVGVPSFIDQYLHEVVSLDEQKLTRDYLTNFIEQVRTKSGKQQADSFTKADIEPLVKANFEQSENEIQALHEKISNYAESKRSGEGNNQKLFDDVAAYALLENLRSMAIWSYKTSERVGEEILAYEPIPGRQEGCVDLKEATGGKAWSL